MVAKNALIALGPEISRDSDSSDSLSWKDCLPLRAEPEAETDSPTMATEWFLAKLVGLAVRRVGWVPRDVYEFVRTPRIMTGMFTTLRVVYTDGNEFHRINIST